MSEPPTSFARIYAQKTCLTGYARTPSFERSRYVSQTGASLLLSTSYKKCKSDQSNQIVVFKSNIRPPKQQVATYFSSVVLSAMQDSILPTKRSHMISHWRSTPKFSSYQWHCPIWIHITFSVNLLIRIILATIKWTCLNVFTRKQVSGLISVRYIKEQII